MDELLVPWKKGFSILTSARDLKTGCKSTSWVLGNLGHGLGGFFHMSLRSLCVLDDSSIPEPIELGKLEKLKT